MKPEDMLRTNKARELAEGLRRMPHNGTTIRAAYYLEKMADELDIRRKEPELHSTLFELEDLKP